MTLRFWPGSGTISHQNHQIPAPNGRPPNGETAWPARFNRPIFGLGFDQPRRQTLRLNPLINFRVLTKPGFLSRLSIKTTVLARFSPRSHTKAAFAVQNTEIVIVVVVVVVVPKPFSGRAPPCRQGSADYNTGQNRLCKVPFWGPIRATLLFFVFKWKNCRRFIGFWGFEPQLYADIYWVLELNYIQIIQTYPNSQCSATGAIFAVFRSIHGKMDVSSFSFV